MADKSVLDDVPVDVSEAKIFQQLPPVKSRSVLADQKEIVGHCPRCGAPIYGDKVTTKEKPEVCFSCTCADAPV